MKEEKKQEPTKLVDDYNPFEMVEPKQKEKTDKPASDATQQPEGKQTKKA
jgi:hypothetical protein